MHESSTGFEIRGDPTTDCGVSCPLASEKKEKRCCHFFSAGFDWILFIHVLQVMMKYINAWISSKFGHIRPRTTELPALERLKLDVSTFSRLFLIRSFSYLQVMMTCMRARRSSKFGQILITQTCLCNMQLFLKAVGMVGEKKIFFFFFAHNIDFG